MRTTLDIDDDVLFAAKEIAAAQQKTAGKIISDLARSALRARPREHIHVRNGFAVLPSRGAVVTVQLVDRLLDEDV